MSSIHTAIAADRMTEFSRKMFLFSAEQALTDKRTVITFDDLIFGFRSALHESRIEYTTKTVNKSFITHHNPERYCRMSWSHDIESSMFIAEQKRSMRGAHCIDISDIVYGVLNSEYVLSSHRSDFKNIYILYLHLHIERTENFPHPWIFMACAFFCLIASLTLILMGMPNEFLMMGVFLSLLSMVFAVISWATRKSIPAMQEDITRLSRE